MLLLADFVESCRRVNGLRRGDRGGRDGTELLRRCVVSSETKEGNGVASSLDPEERGGEGREL